MSVTNQQQFDLLASAIVDLATAVAASGIPVPDTDGIRNARALVAVAASDPDRYTGLPSPPRNGAAKLAEVRAEADARYAADMQVRQQAADEAARRRRQSPGGGALTKALNNRFNGGKTR